MTPSTLAPSTCIPLAAWSLREAPLALGVRDYEAALALPETCPAAVPGDVSGDLFAAGMLPDPLVAFNHRLYSERVPASSWWYRASFATPDGAPPFAELVLNGLDVHADVWFNDHHLGHHPSAFVPFVADVTALMRPAGESNSVVVRLTTGREIAEAVPDDVFPLVRCVPTEGARGYPDRGFPKRVFLRKPAYSWGWDWSPALPTCGITGPCEVRFANDYEIDHVALRTVLPAAPGAPATLHVDLEARSRLSPVKSHFADVSLTLRAPDGSVAATHRECDVLLRGGVTHLSADLSVPNPRLWWPNGYGEQPLYTLEAALECQGRVSAAKPVATGLRTVERDVRPGLFRFRVNGVPVFVQGGNWVPSDHLVGRETPERLAALVAEAAEANFTALRIWGGGRYEPDAFYDECDRRGILVWHDFMSACAPLPYGWADFADVFRAEATYQVRRLQRHPCILQWCGNNEVGEAESWGSFEDPARPLYFEDLARIVKNEAPGTPYWPTSSYGGAESVKDPRVGDCHHWIVMDRDSKFWSDPDYWNEKDPVPIFNSEYGYGGPCSRASTAQYLGVESPALDDLFSAVGHEHTNTFYDIPRVDFSIREHYGAPAASLDDYILRGGLCQGLNLGASLESLRMNDHSWGGIFWMYNDSWGENGWTIVDHYLRRKVSYYAVRRALAPRLLAVRRGGKAFGGSPDEALVLAINTRPESVRLRLRVGYAAYDGSASPDREVEVAVAPHSRAVVATVPLAGLDLSRGTVAAVPDDPCSGFLPAFLREGRHRDTALPPASPHVVRTEVCGDDLLVTVSTDAFAHAVHLVLPDDARPSDNYFDLLPGESRTVRIPGGAAIAQPIVAGNVP